MRAARLFRRQDGFPGAFRIHKRAALRTVKGDFDDSARLPARTRDDDRGVALNHHVVVQKGGRFKGCAEREFPCLFRRAYTAAKAQIREE